MAQPLAEDFPIDPTTTSGTELADILNRFANAVGTNNSGATAPPDTAPGMFWLDTSAGPNGVLKMRNGANTGWITISSPDGSAMLNDGTKAAPGLAFTNEPGLGMYRPATSRIGWAAGGAHVLEWDASNAAASAIKMFPRAAGQTQFQLYNQPQTTAASQLLYMAMGAGSATIQVIGNGGAAKLPLNFDASSFTFGGGNVNVQALMLTSGTYGLSQDANNYYFNYSAGWFWNWTKANGALAYNPGGGPSTSFAPDGMFTAGGVIRSAGGNGPAMFFDGSNANYLAMQGGTGGVWSWQWNRTSGNLSWCAGAAATSVFNIDGNGNVNAIGTINAIAGFTQGSNWACRKEGNIIRQYFNNDVNHRLDYDIATGIFTLAVSLGSYQFNNDGNTAAKNAAGSWAAISDARIKDNVEDYTTGLDAVLALRPRWFNFKPETGMDASVRYVGMLAQEAKAAMPDTVSIAPGKRGEIELRDMHTFDPTNLTYALVNAVKTLHARVAALETS